MVSITAAGVRTEIGRQAQLSKAIARAQSDVSTGTRLQVASDDPVASARIALIRRTQANEAAWSANAQAGGATATRVDTALGDVQTSLDRANELMLRARSGTLTADDRATIATELAGIRDDVAQQAKATDPDGQPLFPDGAPLALPIGHGVTATATIAKTDAFGDIDTVLGDAIASLGIADDTQRAAATGTALDALQKSASGLADVRGAHGLAMQRLDAATDRFAASATELAEEKSQLGDTDVASAIAFIQQSLTQLSAAQTTFARVSQHTLFDLLG